MSIVKNSEERNRLMEIDGLYDTFREKLRMNAFSRTYFPMLFSNYISKHFSTRVGGRGTGKVRFVGATREVAGHLEVTGLASHLLRIMSDTLGLVTGLVPDAPWMKNFGFILADPMVLRVVRPRDLVVPPNGVFFKCLDDVGHELPLIWLNTRIVQLGADPLVPGDPRFDSHLSTTIVHEVGHHIHNHLNRRGKSIVDGLFRTFGGTYAFKRFQIPCPEEFLPIFLHHAFRDFLQDKNARGDFRNYLFNLRDELGDLLRGGVSRKEVLKLYPGNKFLASFVQVGRLMKKIPSIEVAIGIPPDLPALTSLSM
ncbi:MAG: hypothetical protein ACTSU5_06855 [Promethearchaeota archaeon]